jgi:MFS family permease
MDMMIRHWVQAGVFFIFFFFKGDQATKVVSSGRFEKEATNFFFFLFFFFQSFFWLAFSLLIFQFSVFFFFIFFSLAFPGMGKGKPALEEARTPLVASSSGGDSGPPPPGRGGASPTSDAAAGSASNNNNNNSDNVAPPGGVTAETERSYLTSVRSLCALHLILSTDFFIVQPTLYTYLQESFDEGRAFQGYTMGAFFAAQTLCGPLFGYASDRVPVRILLSVAMLVCAIGNLMYSLATSKWMLFAGRFIAGASSAADSVTYGYIGQVSQRKNLTSAMGTLRAFFALGQVLAPLASLLISVSKIDTRVGALHITVYTAPSLITALCCAAYAAFVWLSVRELPPKPKPKSTAKGDPPALAGSAASSPVVKRKKKDLRSVLIALSILLCAFGLIFLMGAVSAFNVPLTTDYYHWGASQNSGMLVGIGVLSIASVHITRTFLKRNPDVDERRYMVIGALGTAGGTMLFFVTPGSEYVPLWRYILGYIISNASFIVAILMAYGIYSKVNAGPASSGFMSWLPAAGSLGRVLGPTYSGAAKVPGQEGNPNYGVLGGVAMSLLGLTAFAFAYRSINVNAVPSRATTDPNNNNDGDYNNDNDEYQDLLETGSVMTEADRYKSQNSYLPPQSITRDPEAKGDGLLGRD